MEDLLTIDGSYGEGGGQVIRTALALSAITGRPIRLTQIRAKRSKPGLQAQHLMSVKAASAICAANVGGHSVGSQEVFFYPTEPVRAGEYRFDIGTAGSTSLVLQTVFVPLVLAEGRSNVTITGGTHNPLAPCADYLERVFLPAMDRMGVSSSLEVPRLGFYPRGGGELHCSFQAESLQAIRLEGRGEMTETVARVITAGLPPDVGARGEQRLRQMGLGTSIEQVSKPSLEAGAATFMALQFAGAHAGFTGLGERGKRMEAVAEDAGKPALEWLKTEATVDEHLADQLVLPAIFAAGESRWRAPVVTEHLRTVIWLVNQFVKRQIDLEELTGWVTVRA